MPGTFELGPPGNLVDSSALPDKRTVRVPLATTRRQSTSENFASPSSALQPEYLHRYLFALQFCDAKEVLDISCGERFASSLLSTVAEHVTTLGIDEEADLRTPVDRGRHNLPASSASFDVAISLDTRTHIAASEQYLGEIKRVLRPGGVLVLSTSDAGPQHSSDQGVCLVELVSKLFANVAFLSQSAVMGSVIAMASGEAREECQRFRRIGGDVSDVSPELMRNTHQICVASDALLP